MASVRKHPQSRFWYAVYRGANGKKVFKSTKKELRREALVVAIEWEAAAEAERSAESGKGKQYAAIVRRAGESAARGELTADAAREMLQEISELATGRRVEFRTVKEWADAWRAEKATTTKVSTHRRHQTSMSAFLASVGGDVPIEQLTAEHIQAFRDSLVEAGKSAKTTNNYLKDVRQCLDKATRLGHTKRNVALAVDYVPMKASFERHPFGDDEIEKLTAAARAKRNWGDWEGMILAGKSGLRIGDAAKLNWGGVDVAKGTIRYTPRKQRLGSDKVFVAPMAPSFRRWLIAQPSTDDPEAPVFPTLAGKATGGRFGLSDCFKRLMATAGVAQDAEDSGTGAQIRYSFHSLRHRAASRLSAAGVAEDLAQAVTGHADEKVHRLYKHTSDEQIAALGEHLD